MHTPYIAFVYFFYGLAFFTMGLMVAQEGGRGSDPRLRLALRPLTGFGLMHGIHEWLEMFQGLDLLPGQSVAPLAWDALRLATLAYSFISLGAFGASLLAPDEARWRIGLLVPLAQAAVWGVGLLVLRGRFALDGELWNVADVWTRYVLAIPSALLASTGLVAQQRAFRRAGLIRFGRDSLWAAVAFAWYGVLGQIFTRASPLPPSNVIHQDLFQELFGFPIQLFRAGMAIAASVFVVRFLRAFEEENRRKIAALQAGRLEEAQRREALRGELLRRVVSAQEAERQRIARELHDETGQALTALGLGLRGVATSLRDEDPPSGRRLRQLQDLTARSLDELRHLIADLRPSHLDDLGLPAALRWYAKDLQTRATLDIDVEVTGDQRSMAPAVKIALFRVAQEALTNVIKHSAARKARVSLAYGQDEIELCVTDDGRGFDVGAQAQQSRPSWGLLGMQERAALLDGHFCIASEPGLGTRVEVVIPYGEMERST